MFDTENKFYRENRLHMIFHLRCKSAREFSFVVQTSLTLEKWEQSHVNYMQPKKLVDILQK